MSTHTEEEIKKHPEEEKFLGNEDNSVDSSVRYAAYARRLRTILQASHRYVAYTSDIGESFRPAVPSQIVSLAYGISWAYILGDVSYEAWKAKLRQEGRYVVGLKPWNAAPPVNPEAKAAAIEADLPDWKLIATERALFQSIASMGLPAFTIHSTVKYATQFANKNIKNATLRLWGPIALGLSVVPILPTLFDKPVEHALGYVFKEIHGYLKKDQRLE
ncbi:hypothetical protein WICMUC_003544 [Wickerhamomyces mucosus]|uniref:Mitochondrial fission process protein 1 n=1 Tax=Wickerhamomyces mucosus TaxID=1378264 RepID=A0A9P8TCV5_9ASCO|nr:hypothetical protein WICMUC_003544 [Wickerhamomyces mucosus]